MKPPALCTQILPVLGLAVLGAAAGCRNSSPSPSRPAARPAAATTTPAGADPNAPPGAPAQPAPESPAPQAPAVDAGAPEMPPPTPQTAWRRTPLDEHSWSVTADPPPPSAALPACPSGMFCTTRPAPAAPTPGMPAPPLPPGPGHCPATVQSPASLSLGPQDAIVTYDVDASAREAALRAGACCYRWVRLCQGGRAPQGNPAAPPTPRGG